MSDKTFTKGADYSGKVTLGGEQMIDAQIVARDATIARLQQELKVARSEAIQARAQAVTVAAERDQLRQELAAEKQWRQDNTTPFLEWAQSYLNSGRWAGHNMFDAIKTELLERDANARALAQELRRVRDIINSWLMDEYHESQSLEESILPNVCDSLAKTIVAHGARYLEPKP